ncbi:aldose epimerase family protein [Maribacter sp. ACAM166]|uniref:aldose epimerase family protein n=1 Tax=Maribacter sp. ACAM166 TaxID=2508996 RepID=UPI0010FD6CCB|nr:aldose epimerase family protein [Maribacter sp. ACAM166]TLP77063.1 galactose mutarotase [Maribacter sp. ACAM166]
MRIAIFNSSSILIFSILMVNFSCKDDKKNKENLDTQKMEKSLSIAKSNYGTTVDGQKVDKFTLENEGGIQVDIITYGGRITSLRTADKNGKIENIVTGFDNLSQYEKTNPFFGALVGRYGNRIAKGKFSLNGTEYSLAKNNGENNLHGGLIGFDKVVWKVEGIEESGSSASLKLSYLSKDMEEGFPGNLETIVTYTLNRDDSFDVLYEATTDKTTVVNLTQHSYFNLSGDFSQTIVDHEIQINADKYIPVNSGLIPTGELAAVEGTPFDFSKAKLINKDINSENKQIELGGGYDHCWVLNGYESGYRSVAKAYHPESGRTLEVLTDEPGIQFYSGNFLDGTLPAPKGGSYAKRSGFCLETQHYPDSPNQPKFPSVTLAPEDTYTTKTTFKFSAK